MRSFVFPFAVLFAAAAHAASGGRPIMLTHAGFLIDASDKPVSEAGLAMKFRIFDKRLNEGQTLQWEAACTVAVKNGHYDVVLGEAPCVGVTTGGLDATLDTSDLPIDAARYLEVAVNDGALSPRLLIGIAPTAAIAAHALDTDALAAKLASTGTINIGSNAVDWTQLKNVPSALADGTDDGATYTGGDGLSLVGNQFGLEAKGVKAMHIGAPASEAGKALVATADGGAAWKTVTSPVLTDSKLLGDGLSTPLSLAADAVTSVELANDAVSSLKIRSDAVTNAKLAADAVTTVKLANDAVTAPKLALDAASLLRVSGGKLGVSGSVLTMAGDVSATKFVGSGAGLTGIPASAIVGSPALPSTGSCASSSDYGSMRFAGGAFQGCTASGWRTLLLGSLIGDTGSYPNKSVAVNDGLLMYFRFDETSGATLADSAGTYTMNVLGTGASGAGKVGGAWNRGTAYANGFKINTGSLDLSTFSVAFWWKPIDMTCHSPSDCAGIVWLTSTSDFHMIGMNGTSTPNRLRFGNFPNGSANARDGGVNLVQDSWIHLALTCAAGVCRMYTNGSLTGSSNDLAIKFGTGGAAYLAHYFTQSGGNTNNHFGRGFFDEFAVWNRSLGADEIAAIYAKQNAGTGLY